MGEKKEKKKCQICVCVIHPFPTLIHQTCNDTQMCNDTQDPFRSLCNEMILTILRLADEEMLRKSGNEVYLRLKKELDVLRCVYLFLSGLKLTNLFLSTTSEPTVDNHFENQRPSASPLDVPILGIRYTSDGGRLVFRVNPPVKQSVYLCWNWANMRPISHPNARTHMWTLQIIALDLQTIHQLTLSRPLTQSSEPLLFFHSK